MSLSLKKRPKSEQSVSTTGSSRAPQGSVIPTVPRVNLLPKEIIEKRGLKSLRRVLALVVLAVILAGAAATFASTLAVNSAQEELNQEQLRTTTLLAEQRRYAEVTVVTDRLRLTEDALEYISRSDLDWSTILGMISSATPDEVLIKSLSTTTATPLERASDSSEPLVPTSIGSIALEGTAETRPDVSSWTNALEALPGINDARILVVDPAEGDDSEFFTVSVTVQLDPSLQRADGRIANLPAEEGTD